MTLPSPTSFAGFLAPVWRATRWAGWHCWPDCEQRCPLGVETPSPRPSRRCTGRLTLFGCLGTLIAPDRVVVVGELAG